MDIQKLLLKDIDENFILNCRRTLNVDDLKESIEETGLQIPIGVKDLGDGSYGLVYGFRRFTAVKQLGWSDVTCRLVENDDEADLLLINLQENVTRKSLTPIEEAQSLARIVALGKDVDDFRKKLGWSKTKVTQRLSLLDMSDDVQESLQQDKISVNQARAIDEAPEHLHEQLLDVAEKGATVKSIREQVDLLLNIVDEDEDEIVTPVIDTNDVDLDIYSNIIKGFLLDLGAKYIENNDTMFNFEVIIRSVDFTNLKASELSGLVNATSMLETFGQTFGRYEKRKNESK
jgi:ParB/RepB/Spo0J family partition protein